MTYTQPGPNQPGGFQAAPSLDDHRDLRPVARPAAVDKAVKLMYAGAGLSLLSLLVGLLMRPSVAEMKDAMEQAGLSLSDAQIEQSLQQSFLTGIIGGLIGVGLWLLHAWAVGKGHNWARITGTVLGALNILGLLFGLLGLAVTLATTSGIIGFVLQVVSAALAAAIIYFMWRPENKPFFGQH
ncbi:MULTISPECIES: hypothetical protein [Kytococcus]|uniref:Uncharacterized protein n=1 Tax=Kytococcus schroeteri TaxID=138300 RepID=A0A2I1PA69_9MICO|nr:MULTISPECIES: hypothetical protein [Kytococcus]OFS15912.1 hypothetical protein HMPREF3099_00850 [Kytococcus sp. HMSC28H12]PKZ41523.1 hypothetical protein CYJ76_07355 [Kytococcus schroeteri]